jgi:metal-dependent amidase/aminoacylase/carboxypeptidase family protein
MAAGCACSFKERGQTYDDLRHNLPLAKAWQDNMTTLHRDVVAPDEPAGSTDMGNVSYLVPAIHAHIQAAPPGTKLLTREFAAAAASSLADEAVVVGAKSLAMTVIDFWLDASLRASAAEAFDHGH